MQKGISLFFGLLSASLTITAQTSTSQQKVAALLRQMTLDEKIGQMTQVTLGVVATAEDGVLDPEGLKKAVQ
jgi:beta-glucosidase